jgi:hypothetical protein
MDFNKPHMVPQTTKSLAAGAEGQRQKQIGVYKKDRAHNQSQMDDIRHAQYRKQNTAVNKQKSRMQTNAAQSSKAVTGSANYFKEGKTLEGFLDEARNWNRKPQIADKRRKRAKAKKDEDSNTALHKGGAIVKRSTRPPEVPDDKKREQAIKGGAIVKYTGPKDEDKKDEDKKEEPKSEKKPKGEKKPKSSKFGTDKSRDEYWAARTAHQQQATKHAATNQAAREKKDKDMERKRSMRDKYFRQKNRADSPLGKFAKAAYTHTLGRKADEPESVQAAQTGTVDTVKD